MFKWHKSVKTFVWKLKFSNLLLATTIKFYEYDLLVTNIDNNCLRIFYLILFYIQKVESKTCGDSNWRQQGIFETTLKIYINKLDKRPFDLLLKLILFIKD